MRRVPILVLLALLLFGCSGGSKSATHGSGDVSPSPTPHAGPGAYLAAVRQLVFGDADLAGAPDAQLLALGNAVCGDLSSNTYSAEVQSLLESKTKPSTDEAVQFVTTAITNLCPDHRVDIP